MKESRQRFLGSLKHKMLKEICSLLRHQKSNIWSLLMFSYSTNQDLKSQLQTSQQRWQKVEEKVVKGTRNLSLHQTIIIMQQLTLHLDSQTIVNQLNNLSKHQLQGMFSNQKQQQTQKMKTYSRMLKMLQHFTIKIHQNGSEQAVTGKFIHGLCSATGLQSLE